MNDYLICLRCTRGSTIKRTVQVGRSDDSFRGSILGWKDTFAIDDKGGEIYQMHKIEAWFQGESWSYRCKGQRHGSGASMSDMISILHQSVSINAKGGDFLLIGLVFIDVNP
jgi:hypothetical protein